MIALLAVVGAAVAVFLLIRSRKAHAGERADQPPPRYVAPPETRPIPSVAPFEPPPKPAPLPPPPPVVATPARLLPDHGLATQAILTPGLLSKIEAQQVGWAMATDWNNILKSSIATTFG